MGAPQVAGGWPPRVSMRWTNSTLLKRPPVPTVLALATLSQLMFLAGSTGAGTDAESGEAVLPTNFELPDKQRSAMSDLEKKSGTDFDKAYIDHEVDYHQQVLETATKALGAAQNQELKDLIQKAAPVIQKHLDRAKEIQKKLSTTA